MSQSFIVKAPGKIIISGEYAVAYGAPAIAVAIDQHIRIKTTLIADNSMVIESPLYNESLTLDFSQIFQLHADIFSRYQAYQKKTLDISDVIQTPGELVFYIIADFFIKKDIQPEQGLHFHFSHSLPIGCGCGSSAAVINAVLMTLLHYYQKEMSKKELHDWSTRIEHLQHGQSSGLDTDVVIYGGFRYFQHHQARTMPVPTIKFYTLASGTPMSSTGQCMVHAQAFFHQSNLADEFSQTTDRVFQAILTQNKEQLIEGIRHNHRLLCQLNVVPDNIQALIKTIELQGGAAKVCGAGTLSGLRAGMILVVGPDTIEKTLASLPLPFQPVVVDEAGCQVVAYDELSAVY